MDQPSNSIVIVKSSNIEDKSNEQSNNKPMVVEPAVDFRQQLTTNKKFSTRQQMQD
jgi:hypothetical protein